MKREGLLDIAEFNNFFDKVKNESHQPVCIKDLLYDVVELIQTPNKLFGIKSGLAALDKKTLGWKNGDVALIGVNPNFNKSDFGKTLLLNPVVNEKKSILYFINTNEPKSFVGGLCSAYSGLFETTFKYASKALCEAPIYLECDNQILINELKHKIYMMVENYELDLIIIEEFNYITHSDKQLSKQDAQAHIFKTIKEIAVFFDIPIIILTQLPVQNKYTVPEQFNISDAFEDYSDIIAVLGSPHYTNQSNEVRLELFKNKNNVTGDIILNYASAFNYFTDFDKNNKVDFLIGYKRNYFSI